MQGGQQWMGLEFGHVKTQHSSSQIVAIFTWTRPWNLNTTELPNAYDTETKIFYLTHGTIQKPITEPEG